MPCLTAWAPFFLCSGFAHVDNVITKRWLHQHAPELSATLGNLPEPASGTHTSTPPHPANLRNPPEPSETLLNRLEPASGTYTSTHRNSPEPSGTFHRNLLLTHTGTHRSLSGLKTPLAHAVGEQTKSEARELQNATLMSHYTPKGVIKGVAGCLNF